MYIITYDVQNIRQGDNTSDSISDHTDSVGRYKVIADVAKQQALSAFISYRKQQSINGYRLINAKLCQLVEPIDNELVPKTTVKLTYFDKLSGKQIIVAKYISTATTCKGVVREIRYLLDSNRWPGVSNKDLVSRKMRRSTIV
jgi:hypothetical protein